MSSPARATTPQVDQILVNLNFWEYKQLEYWLTDHYSECRIRELYDNWSEPYQKQWYAIEGAVTQELEMLIKLRYGDKDVKGRY
jgi:hypothetical protein